MTPYYEDSFVTIYHGDCREILPSLPKIDLVLTDPPYGVGVKYGSSYVDDRATYWQWFLPTVEMMRRAASVVAFTHCDIGHITTHDAVAIWDKGSSFGPRWGNSPLIAGGWEPIYLFGIHSIGVHGPALESVLRFSPAGNGVQSAMGREKWKATPTLKTTPYPNPKDSTAN